MGGLFRSCNKRKNRRYISDLQGKGSQGRSRSVDTKGKRSKPDAGLRDHRSGQKWRVQYIRGEHSGRRDSGPDRHPGWKEAGGTNAPTYSGDRKTCAWDAASGGAKALSSALSYTFTGTGTVKGGFTVFGSGALATKDSTGGILLSAATFDEGDRAIAAPDDVLNVSYTLTLT